MHFSSHIRKKLKEAFLVSVWCYNYTLGVCVGGGGVGGVWGGRRSVWCVWGGGGVGGV